MDIFKVMSEGSGDSGDILHVLIFNHMNTRTHRHSHRSLMIADDHDQPISTQKYLVFLWMSLVRSAGAMYVFDRRRAVRGHDLVGEKVPLEGSVLGACCDSAAQVILELAVGKQIKVGTWHVAQVSAELRGRCTRASGSAELARCRFSFA